MALLLRAFLCVPIAPVGPLEVPYYGILQASKEHDLMSLLLFRVGVGIRSASLKAMIVGFVESGYQPCNSWAE